MVVITALFALVVAQAFPEPSATPKEIIHVHSRTFCTVMRQNVAVAVASLDANDKIIERGKKGFVKMGHDVAMGSDVGRSFDMMYLGSLVDGIVHNLELVDRMLDDPKRFAATVTSDDDVRLLELRDRLREVADNQRSTLDEISGLLETQRLADLQNDPTGDAIGASLGNTMQHQSPSPSNGDPTHIANTGLSAALQVPPGAINPAAQKEALVVGGGIYGPFIDEIDAAQEIVAAPKAVLTQALEEAARSCGGKP